MSQTGSNTITSGMGFGYYVGAQLETPWRSKQVSASVVEFLGSNAQGGVAGPNINGFTSKGSGYNVSGMGLDAGVGAGLVITSATNANQFMGTVPTTNVTFAIFGGTFAKAPDGTWTLTLGLSKGWGFGWTNYPVTTR